MSSTRRIEHWFALREGPFFVKERNPSGIDRGNLVFIHGRLGDASIWEPVIERLSSQFRCLSFDLPGYGRCSGAEQVYSVARMAEVLRQLLGYLVPGAAVLVGHDIGGAVAQFCAVHWPERVSGLVLANPACLSEPLSPLARGFLGWALRRNLKRLLGAAEDGATLRALVEGSWGEGSGRPKAQVFHAWQELQASWPGSEARRAWREAIHSINKPTLLLWGKRDVLNPADRMPKLMRLLPDAFFFLNEEAGHWPSVERPEWFAAKLRDFLFHATDGGAITGPSVRRSLSR